MKKFIYGTKKYLNAKQLVLNTCGVVNSELFNSQDAVNKRINYLKNYLIKTNMKGYVLGISGGVDSTVVGKLCQIACSQLRQKGYNAQFIAMRLPSGIQFDEQDAQAALQFINPDKLITVNIGETANILSNQGVQEYNKLEVNKLNENEIDFNKGNIKARLRMISQYQVASMYKALVIGTDHNAENCTGFFTKWGDGACDLIVLNDLNKTQVRMVAKELGAPEKLYNKAPTADLEELKPGKLDDDGFGFPYWKLDLFLEGKQIDKETEEKIIHQFLITQHKRKPIVIFK